MAVVVDVVVRMVLAQMLDVDIVDVLAVLGLHAYPCQRYSID